MFKRNAFKYSSLEEDFSEQGHNFTDKMKEKRKEKDRVKIKTKVEATAEERVDMFACKPMLDQKEKPNTSVTIEPNSVLDPMLTNKNLLRRDAICEETMEERYGLTQLVLTAVLMRHLIAC